MISHDPAPSHQCTEVRLSDSPVFSDLRSFDSQRFQWSEQTQCPPPGRSQDWPAKDTTQAAPSCNPCDHPTWWKSISWAQQNLRNPTKSNKVHMFLVFFMNFLYDNIWKLPQLGASPRQNHSPAPSLKPIGWSWTSKRLEEPGIRSRSSHVSTRFNTF